MAKHKDYPSLPGLLNRYQSVSRDTSLNTILSPFLAIILDTTLDTTRGRA